MFLIGSPKVFLNDVLEFLVLLGASAFFVIAILISEFESEGDPKQSKMEMKKCLKMKNRSLKTKKRKWNAIDQG